MANTEKLIELKDLNEADPGQTTGFKIVNADDIEGTEAEIAKNHPSKYYEFADKEVGFPVLRKFFLWMRDTEITYKEAAGIKFAIMGAAIFGLIGGLKVEYFYQISSMNYFYLQFLVSLGIFFLCCRQFDVLPFLEDEQLQTKLKISAGCNLAGIIIYIASWNYWPRQYSHFLLCAIPFIENLREAQKTSYKTRDLILLGVNYIGFMILLTIPDREKSITMTGFLLALVGTALFWYGFQNLKALGPSNPLSIGVIQTLFMSVFMSGFFGLVKAVPPTIIEAVVIALYGIPTSMGILLMIRSAQITKPSHCLLTASIALAIISWVRSINMEGLEFQGIIGILMAVGCACYILWEQQDKTTIITYMRS